MKRGLILSAFAVFAFILVVDGSLQGGDKGKDGDKVTIKVVMKKAMVGGLCKKVAGGSASKEEQAELVKLFEGLAKCEPPKGDAASWKEKTEALVKAAKAGDGEALKKAANCAACHGEHKGKKK